MLTKWCKEGGGKGEGVIGREKGYSIMRLLEMATRLWGDQAKQEWGCCQCDADILQQGDEGQGFEVW
jgi:hypothetical protein